MTDNRHDQSQKQHDLEQHEVKQVLDFLKRYGKLIAAGVIAATLAVLVSRAMAANKAAKIAEAEQQLNTTRTPQQLEELIRTYKSTPTVPVARLKLARELFNSGETAQARMQYEEFVKRHKNSAQLPVAVLGLAHCTEAEGRFDDAANELKKFLSEYPNHYLSASAVLALARCLEQAGRIDEARITLEDFLAEHPDSQWTGPAEGSLLNLGKTTEPAGGQ